MTPENTCQPDINVVVSSKTEQTPWEKAATLEIGEVHTSKLAFQEYRFTRNSCHLRQNGLTLKALG